MVDHDFAKEEEDLEALFDEVEIPAEIREQRMAVVKDTQMYLQKGGFGQCDEVEEERQVLEITANEERCVVHFQVPTFHRCLIMQGHIDKLARKHFKTKFIKVNAENAHWVCAKLNVRELPAVLCFVGAQCKDRVVGFDELGGGDGFPTEVLERRLHRAGVITMEGMEDIGKPKGRTSLFGYKTAEQFDQDSDDSDDD